jgi:peptidoglycan hydrolase-like protein with peptidoglycan-binding domain
MVEWAAALGMIVCVWGGPLAAARKKSTAKKPAATTTAAAGKSSKKTTASRGAKTSWRNRQTAPTPERYREIQQALAAKGYLNTDQVTGHWTDASADAMRRFQTDQKLDPSGKINSLSLIALGLGPKHEPAGEGKPLVPPAQAPATDKPGQ